MRGYCKKVIVREMAVHRIPAGGVSTGSDSLPAVVIRRAGERGAAPLGLRRPSRHRDRHESRWGDPRVHTDALWRYGTAVRLAIPAPPFSPIRTSRSGSLRHGAKG
jgi:hypothetical protein